MEQNEKKKNLIQFFGKSNPCGPFGKLQCWKIFLKNKVETDLHLEHTNQKHSWFAHSKMNDYFFLSWWVTVKAPTHF